ncbi:MULTISPECIES: hypothetical protein [Pseudonocardia]|uniref:hypothetical protein n=1 Tax=Pseudonocardia TaxID=1847 RepID=UPI000F7B9661|nr:MULTISPECIES: hypothetical protein [Pseudonocardia]
MLRRGRSVTRGADRDQRTALLLDGLVTLTSVLDGFAHLVTESELTAPAAIGAGRYGALCGLLVAPTPMVVPDGARCARCAELRGPGAR